MAKSPYGYSPKTKEKDQEKTKSNRDLIIERMKQTTAKQKKPNLSPLTPNEEKEKRKSPEEYEEMIAALTSELKDAKKKQQKAEKRYEQKNEEKIDLDKKHTKLKIKLNDKDREIGNYKENEKQYKAQLLKNEQKEKELLNTIGKLEIKVEQDSKIIKSTTRVMNQNTKHLREIKQLKGRITNLENNMQAMSLIKNESKDELVKSNKLIVEKNRVIKRLELELESENGKIDASRAINALHQKADSLTNKQLKSVEKLIERKRRINNPNVQRHLKAMDKKATKERVAKQKEIFQNNLGYVISKNDEWWFVDLDNNMHPVEKTDKEIINDGPVRVKKTQGSNTVVIQKVLPLESIVSETEEYKQRKIHSAKKKKGNTNKPLEEIAPIGDFKVLLIGSKDMIKYRDHLSKRGVEVIAFDPYEQNIALLKSLYNVADIVIVLGVSASHIIYGHIDRTDPKVEVMTSMNTDKVEARVRFAALNLKNKILPNS